MYSILAREIVFFLKSCLTQIKATPRDYLLFKLLFQFILGQIKRKKVNFVNLVGNEIVLTSLSATS